MNIEFRPLTSRPHDLIREVTDGFVISENGMKVIFPASLSVLNGETLILDQDVDLETGRITAIRSAKVVKFHDEN